MTLLFAERQKARTFAVAKLLSLPVMTDRTSTSILIRLTREDDWRSLKDLRLAALLDAPTAFGVSHAAASAYTDQQWRERAAASHPRFWLAFLGGEAVGMIGGGVSARQRYNLIAMWVAPHVRGSGIAAQLVGAVKSEAATQGHASVFLDVAPGNRRAAAFYEKQGFLFIDEREPLASHPHIQVQTMQWSA
jgi:ribosomal protein S18 acetylase RimI-like enzyme